MSIALIHEDPNRKTHQIWDEELGVFVLGSENGTPHRHLSMCEHAVNTAYAEFRRTYGMERTRGLAKLGIVKAMKAANAHNHDMIKEGKPRSIYLNSVSLDIGVIIENDVYLVHVGSSGIYQCNNDSLKRLSEDHTIDGNNGDVLLQGVGLKQTIDEQRTKAILRTNDYLLLCNSEFCKVMGEERIRGSLYRTLEPVDEIARNMKNEAISKGCNSICAVLYKLSN
jgi:hypothetical protein